MGLFSLVGKLIGGGKMKKGSRKAADLLSAAANKGIDEDARQFEATRGDFAAEQRAGEDALAGLRRLIGLDGGDGQQAAIDALRASPGYKSLYNNGRETLLANASATGGLRGGNVQGALYELGEDTLSNLIQRQLAGYGALVDLGTGADAAVGNFGANSVARQSDLRNFGADAQAQGVLTRAGINAANWQNVGTYLDDTIKNILPGGSKVGKFLGKFM